MHASLNELDLVDPDDPDGPRSAEWGGMSIMVNRVPPDFDLTPIVAQLPGGACPVPHWGYVLEGSLTIGYTDGTSETISAGEVFHFQSGHSQFGSSDGARWIEISPAAEMAEVISKMMDLMAQQTED